MWIWKFQGNDLFFDINDYIRLKVETELFVDVGPVKQIGPNGEEKPREAPYKILGSVAEQGLGVVRWWE